MRGVPEDLLVGRLSDRHEVLLVWHDGALLLPLLLH